MKNLILRILREQINQDNALSKVEVIMLKHLNKKYSEMGKKHKGLELVKDVVKKMGLDENLARYYAQVWKLNYRKNGDYENITKAEFIDPKTYKPYRTTNVKAAEYTVSKLPFKGSNLEGKWDKDANGVKYYVVTSYGWYPIFLYKEGIWYEAIKRYSSTTGKQMSQSMPYRYNYDLRKNVVLVTKDEMSYLESRGGLDDIMRIKKEKLLNKKSEYISDRAKNIKIGYRTADDYNRGYFKVRFKVTDINEEDGKVIISVLVQDGGNVDGGKMVPSKGGYLRGEVENWNKERVEKELEGEILSNFKEYTGNDYNLDKSLIEVRFTHQYEK